MPCALDELAAHFGIKVDYFCSPRNHSSTMAAGHFLTHAHKDHISCIGSSPVVWCTALTRDLLLATREVNEDTTNFVCLPFGEDIPVGGSDLLVRALPSDHCPGSCMFLFSSTALHTLVLYTGDFVYSQRTGAVLEDALRAFSTGGAEFANWKASVHYDDTFEGFSFEGIPAAGGLPCAHKLAARLLQGAEDGGKQFLDVGVMGRESVLPEVRKRLRELEGGWDLVVHIHHSLPPERVQQIRSVLPKFFGVGNPDADADAAPRKPIALHLGTKRKDSTGGEDGGGETWYHLSSTRFIMGYEEIQGNHQHLWYATHSDKHGLEAFKEKVRGRLPMFSSLRFVRCGFSDDLGKLKGGQLPRATDPRAEGGRTKRGKPPGASQQASHP